MSKDETYKALCTTVDQAVAALGIVTDTGQIRDALLSGLRQALAQAQAEVNDPAFVGHKAIDKATQGIRRFTDPDGRKFELGFTLIPMIDPAILINLINAGKRPHTCPSCQCPPVGGTTIDAQRSGEAVKLEAVSSAMGKLPAPTMLLIGTNVESAFRSRKAAGATQGRNGQSSAHGAQGSEGLAMIPRGEPITWTYYNRLWNMATVDTDQGVGIDVQGLDSGPFGSPSDACHAIAVHTAQAAGKTEMSSKLDDGSPNPAFDKGRHYDPKTLRFNGWRELSFPSKQAVNAQRQAVGATAS